jgi:hypothetical protein
VTKNRRKRTDRAVFLVGLMFAFSWARERATTPPDRALPESALLALPVATAPPIARAPARRRRRGVTALLTLAAISLTVMGVRVWHALRPSAPTSTPVAQRVLSPTPSRATDAVSHGAFLPIAPSTVSVPQHRQGRVFHVSSKAAGVKRHVTRTHTATRHAKARARTRQHSAAHRRAHVVRSHKRSHRHAVAKRPLVVATRVPRTLRWNRVANASYYNLVLWRDGKRFLDLWPTSAHVVLPTASVENEAPVRLTPGRYLWFAYPGFGPKASQRYGALAGSGVLVVQSKGGQ